MAQLFRWCAGSQIPPSTMARAGSSRPSQGRHKILNEGLSSQTASRLGCDGEQNEGNSCHSSPMAAQGRSRSELSLRLSSPLAHRVMTSPANRHQQRTEAYPLLLSQLSKSRPLPTRPTSQPTPPLLLRRQILTPSRQSPKTGRTTSSRPATTAGYPRPMSRPTNSRCTTT